MLQPEIHHFSKEKQYEVIKSIIEKYPTASDFKNALLKNNDPKLRSLAETINPDMDRYQYIDFLQYVFVKYSGYGKFLSTLLSGIGLGILGNYLGLYFSFNPKNIAINTAGLASGDVNRFNDAYNGLRSELAKTGTGGALSGTIAGGLGAGAVNTIWNWNDNKNQSKIEDLKDIDPYDNINTLNHMKLKKMFKKFKR